MSASLAFLPLHNAQCLSDVCKLDDALEKQKKIGIRYKVRWEKYNKYN